MSKSIRPRLGDVRGVYQLLGEVRELRADPVAMDRHMIERLCRMLGARQGAAVLMSGYTATGDMRLLRIVGAGWADPAAASVWKELLAQGTARDDLLVDRSSQIERTIFTIRRDDLFPDEEWNRIRHPYIDFVRETRVTAHLAMLQRLGPHDLVRAVTLHRTEDPHNFSLRDRNVLRLFNLELYRAHAQGELDPPMPMPHLSPRQHQVLARLLAGDSVKQTAKHLGIAYQTTADHVQRIYAAFGVNSRAELLAKFVSPSTTPKPPALP